MTVNLDPKTTTPPPTGHVTSYKFRKNQRWVVYRHLKEDRVVSFYKSP